MSRLVPRLHLIGPLVADPAVYPTIAAAAVDGGCDAVHVRLPGAATDEMLATTRAVRGAIGERAALIVNDRLDIGLLAESTGVQLGEHSFSVVDARRLLPATMLIGRSVHDIAGARDAAEAGADYLIAGHVFDTDSKAGTPGRGLDWLAEVANAVHIPVIALGGITAERVPAVLGTGVYGVALGRELLLADDPAAAAATVRRHLLAT